MNAKRVKRSLRRIVGRRALLDDPASLAAYAYDSSLQTARPDFVLFPRTTEHVAEIVRSLRSEGIPYVARGAGTNLSGGSIPLKGGAVIALARMNRILDIETEKQCARVEPGTTNLALQEALGPRGYFFAPDPASQKVSTLGGNVAENSGGPHCLKYGVTVNHVLGVKLVTPGGEIAELGGETLESTGYDLLGLVVGSEGTLGIVTEIVCRILPLPESTETMLAVCNSTDEASQTVSDIIAAGILPATLEMMDNMVIRAVEASIRAGYPTDAAAVLIIEIDGISEGLDETAKEIETICRRNGVREVRTARDDREREQLWAGRRGAFGAVARLFPNYSVSDGTVPRTQLPRVLRQVSDIGKKYDLEIGNVFHAGDGNLHPLVFFDARDKEQLERVHRAGKEILDACIAAGGTITGEHGIGAEKIHAMPMFFGPAEIDLMRRIKNALDPDGLCNPNKILPETGDRAHIFASAGNTKPTGQDTKNRGSVPIRYTPETPSELADAIHHLREDNKTFAAVGAQTLFPALPSRHAPDAFIDTTRMRAIVEHDAANLTVTAQAGLSLGDLQETLSGAGQFLPLDAPAHATLGGITATALSGPRRHIHGAARDLVLGLTFATADGTILSAGGKTVKNVAGYDFGKLLIGSWGTLGVITEITFRLLPLPKASGAVIAAFDNSENARAAAKKIIGAKLNPSVVTLMNPHATARLAYDLAIPLPAECRALVLGAEGFAPAVERQLAGMERICKGNATEVSRRIAYNEYGSLIAAITGLCCTAPEPKPLLSLRIAAPRGREAAVVKEIEKLETDFRVAALVLAHLAGGLIYSHFALKEDKNTAGTAKKLVGTLASRFPRPNIIAFGVGSDSVADVPFVTGNRAPASWLAAIKNCFDPKNIMNPGISLW